MNLEEYFSMLQKMAQRQKQQHDNKRREIDDYHARHQETEDDSLV